MSRKIGNYYINLVLGKSKTQKRKKMIAHDCKKKIIKNEKFSPTRKNKNKNI
jgi:hypothetical protein